MWEMLACMGVNKHSPCILLQLKQAVPWPTTLPAVCGICTCRLCGDLVSLARLSSSFFYIKKESAWLHGETKWCTSNVVIPNTAYLVVTLFLLYENLHSKLSHVI